MSQGIRWLGAAALLALTAAGCERPAVDAVEDRSSAALGRPAPPGAAASTGETLLSVVSYNVHGLPAWIARDDPEQRMPRIGRLLSVYDVALVQEDWWYPEGLRSDGRPRLDLRVPRAGLSLLANLAPGQLLDRVAAAYGACAGWLRGANDCFADKGALRARVRLANASLIDLWNTHLDAGRGDDDQAVRIAQLDALAERVERESEGRAVVLAGDLNLDWDEPGQRAAVDAFRARLGLADSGARPSHPTRGAGYAGRVDYLLYRGARDVELQPVDAGEAREFGHEGGPLSDHPAIYAKFRVETAE